MSTTSAPLPPDLPMPNDPSQPGALFALRSEPGDAREHRRAWELACANEDRLRRLYDRGLASFGDLAEAAALRNHAWAAYRSSVSQTG